ncbi:MAG: hypothetical protein L6R39_000680 [Caloplaca ligustica]|nr:MAG: hypothetical protein L6R39_000680 [Caloplaca ligustica]
MHSGQFKMHGTQAKRPSFATWSSLQGINTDGIDYQRIPGRGFGVVARRRLKAGEQLVSVPLSALLTVDNVPARVRKQHGSISVHGLLASFLAFGENVEKTYAPWASTWPTVSDLCGSLPLCWPQYGAPTLTERLLDESVLDEDLVLLLPPAIECPAVGAAGSAPRSDKRCGLLQTQRRKLRADWQAVSRIMPNASFESYLYFWLVVNTRSFYYEMPNVKTQPSREGCMAMVPFIDLFNHSDSGSDHALRPEAGDEVYVSYGPHSNDFLLVEYGFILDNNRWDSTPIDHILMGYLVDTPAEEQLQQAGYLGDYAVTRDGVCWRTEVAVHTQTLTDSAWKRFTQGLDVDDDDYERKGEVFIRNNLLEPLRREAEQRSKQLHNSIVLAVNPRQVLIQRWKQIRALSEKTADLLPGHNGNQNGL